MSLAFLTPTTVHGAPPAASPLAGPAERAGARMDVRDGWLVPVGFGDADAERRAAEATVAFADASALAKVELRGPAEALAAAAGERLETGTATVRDGAWWCPLTPERVLVLGAPLGELDAGHDVAAVDVTTQWCGLRLQGPLARELLARFCALDVRSAQAPPRAVRPGSIARCPGTLVVEAEDTLLLLVGAALAEYLWTVVADAAGRLGGRPAGVDAVGGAIAALSRRTADRA